MGKIAFHTKLLLFTLPMLVLWGGTLFVAVYSGEAMPLQLVYETQLNSPDSIYLTWHRQQEYPYKYMAYQRLPREVAVIGSSRILTFRGGFLNLKPTTAYNLGLNGGQPAEIEIFLDTITPETAPKVMLMAVDQFTFNANWVYNNGPRSITAAEIDPDYLTLGTRQMIELMLDGKTNLERQLGRVSPTYGELALGTEAILGGAGYAIDGALQLNPKALVPEILQLRHQEAFDVMRQGIYQYVRGDTVSETALVQLDRILDKAAALNIEVIGFTPPYMPTLYEEMIREGQHTYWDKALPRVQAVFDSHDFHFFDFSDVSDFSSDAEMRDGNHPSELLMLRMYIRMLRDAPEVLGQYSDLKDLRALIRQAPNPHEVIPRQKPADAGG